MRAEPRHMFTNNIKSTVKVSVNPLAMLGYIQATVPTLTRKRVLFFRVFTEDWQHVIVYKAGFTGIRFFY